MAEVNGPVPRRLSTRSTARKAKKTTTLGCGGDARLQVGNDCLNMDESGRRADTVSCSLRGDIIALINANMLSRAGFFCSSPRLRVGRGRSGTGERD